MHKGAAQMLLAWPHTVYLSWCQPGSWKLCIPAIALMAGCTVAAFLSFCLRGMLSFGRALMLPQITSSSPWITCTSLSRARRGLCPCGRSQGVLQGYVGCQRLAGVLQRQVRKLSAEFEMKP